MTDRKRSGKTLGQDAAGFVFCLVGGFFAVSLALFLRGQEPKPGLVGIVTGPVVQLGEWLGAWAGLALSLAVAGLGTVLFLRREAIRPGRWLGGFAVLALGLAFLLGAALDRGGDVGAIFPGLVSGMVGRVLGAVLGLALLWIGWTLLPVGSLQPRAGSASEALQRIAFSGRQEPAAGVSPAEAALLVSEPKKARAPAPAEEPVRDETIRPYSPPKHAAKAKPEAKREEPSVIVAGNSRTPAQAKAVAPAPAEPSVRPLETRAPARSEDLPSAVPPAPAWEVEAEPAFFPLEEPAAPEASAPVAEPEPLPEPTVAAEAPSAAAAPEQASATDEPEAAPEPELPADRFAAARRALEAELALADLEVESIEEERAEAAPTAQDEVLAEADEEEEEEDDALVAARAEEAPDEETEELPAAAWEQDGLFDADEEAEPAKPARVELTPTFDFDADEPRRPAHEPEVAATEEDPFASEPVGSPTASAEAAAAPEAPAAAEPAAEPEPEEEPEAVLQPAKPRPRTAPKRKPRREAEPALSAAFEASEPQAEPGPQADDAGARWSHLVFEAGCAILEQNRVAVSMLERRFGIDFDQACRVLDELQEAGLIGPYMGGRTRDILLTREQWLSHAPQSS